MNTVNLRRYSEADTLRELSPRTLVALMDDHREFLAGKGVNLPPVGEEAELDYESLATIFLSPDDIPRELVEKFGYSRNLVAGEGARGERAFRVTVVGWG